jgi:hypothetical protein
MLRSLCASLGLEFIPSEMRWGIREEASNNHETSDICMAELGRCQQESLGVNYVLILGEKYGFRPVPSAVEEAEFNSIVEAVCAERGDASARQLRERWFRLDTNVVPAVYRLRPVLSFPLQLHPAFTYMQAHSMGTVAIDDVTGARN